MGLDHIPSVMAYSPLKRYESVGVTPPMPITHHAIQYEHSGNNSQQNPQYLIKSNGKKEESYLGRRLPLWGISRPATGWQRGAGCPKHNRASQAARCRRRLCSHPPCCCRRAEILHLSVTTTVLAAPPAPAAACA